MKNQSLYKNHDGKKHDNNLYKIADDTELIAHLAGNHSLIVTLEENVLQGGYGLAVTAYIHEHFPHIKVLNVALPDAYVEHGNVSILREGLGIDSDSIIRSMKAGGWLG